MQNSLCLQGEESSRPFWCRYIQKWTCNTAEKSLFCSKNKIKEERSTGNYNHFHYFVNDFVVQSLYHFLLDKVFVPNSVCSG